MNYTADSDPLCYPGTSVLKNLLDIESPELLEEAELALFLIRADEPLPGGELDRDHYLSLHRHLFQDVYPWAGEIRTIRIGKDGNWFCYPEFIATELDRAFHELGDPGLLGQLSKPDFARKVAHFLAELNAVHPFREGNGRTQLTFMALLAEQAGFDFSEQALDPPRVIDAMIKSVSGDEAELIALIADIIA